MKRIFYILLILSGFQISAQKVQSLNLKKYKIAVLSDSLRESSGLTNINGRLFSFNDSGNTSKIFEIKPGSSNIENTFQTGLKNIDWEAMTNDGEDFYIGEFGNNLGTRKDLKVYQIPFKNDSIVTDSIKAIPFFYPEQIDFTPKNINNNFDAEAMIFLDGNIHLFTKEWITNTVSHYFIDKSLTENQPAQKLESFKTGFVVTDASFFENKLYIVGYTKKASVYLMIFEKDDSGNLFFNKPSKKFSLGRAFKIGQIEGITATEKGIYISGERFGFKIIKVPQSLYFVPFEDLQ
ncbi:hypothetical protein ACFOWU_04655 [Epilithonimonas zeae]|uniref:T9SS C-terminal target domain-containing protein n=1 Tax=Epilithonimonas zeae TaxID=1416779 RepID=A0A1N6F1D4_9FLAO|nr:hypothetical protein [Epilithonimonas zeae]SIN89027.1 hypothetical protein SAMN05444409_0982 [Epilithonimonas zeae]